jgi:hypothetical protein
MQIVEVDVAAHAARRKTKVILKPVNAANFLNMPREHHVGGAVRHVEVIDVDVAGVDNAGKHIAPVGKFDF